MRLAGGRGTDRITGSERNDAINPGPGRDIIDARGGNDSIGARDRERDLVNCGTGRDLASRDSRTDVLSGCENVRVGILRLTPRNATAKAGQTARLRLSWQHPRSARRLRTITLHLYDRDLPVGQVTIRPATKQVVSDGDVRLQRRTTRLGRTGRTVTARLALRLDPSLAGKRLRAEVEATDTNGTHQIETAAGTIQIRR